MATNIAWRPLVVHPFHLEQATRAITKRWGILDPAGISEDDQLRIETVRAAVASAGFGARLSRKDAKLALRMCVRDEESIEWKEAAVRLAGPHLAGFGLRFLCHIYCFRFNDKRLRKHVSRRVADREPDRRPFPPEVPKLLFSNDPAMALARDALKKRLRLNDLESCYELPSGSLLLQEVLANLLLNASGDWYGELSETEVKYVFERVFTTHDSMAGFVESVVQACHMADWNPERIENTRFARELMETVTSREALGSPSRNVARWTLASKKTRQLIQWWINSHEIAEFFDRVDANPDRKDFWRRAARVILDLHHCAYCGVFAMQIGDIYFVEFGEIGNACYVYSAEDFASVKSAYDRWASNWGETNHLVATGKWKRKDMLLRSGVIRDVHGRECANGAVRLIHSSGILGWQPKFKAVVEKLTGARLDSRVS